MRNNKEEQDDDDLLTFLAKYGWSFFASLILVGILIYLGAFSGVFGNNCTCKNEIVNSTTTLNCTDAHYDYSIDKCEIKYDVITNGVKTDVAWKWKR